MEIYYEFEYSNSRIFDDGSLDCRQRTFNWRRTAYSYHRLLRRCLRQRPLCFCDKEKNDKILLQKKGGGKGTDQRDSIEDGNKLFSDRKGHPTACDEGVSTDATIRIPDDFSGDYTRRTLITSLKSADDKLMSHD
ncbi:unnamed protein product [Angiostrongylus costaricensis]|uniref:Uncharacterized protein n=1 Tax=Angiostrongylus costaricensis TaxID=334426 RepID=A0A0R3PJS2_ANGCS|nr:unnamed protein product [Angiostrongylus costaricensis]